MRRRTALTRMTTLVAALLAVALLAGCGGDDGDATAGGDGSANEVTTLKVGVIPIADVAPLYLGMKKGFFEDERLRIEPQLAQGGAAIVPAVVSGANDIGFSNVVSLMIAGGEGLPLEIVSPANEEAAEEDEAFTRVLVSRNSDVRSVADLDGRRIAVNTLRNINQVGMLAALEQAGATGVEPEYVEVPIPDMPSALASGEVDAIISSEPFVTITADDTRPIASPYWAIAPNLTVAAYFTTSKMLEENPELVERFQRAMATSLEYAQGHQDEVRQILTSYANIEPDVAREVFLPAWSGQLNLPTMQRAAEIAEGAQFLESAPNFEELVWEGVGQ